MNRRALELLEEMQKIFGGSFGDDMMESDELVEAGSPDIKGKFAGGPGPTGGRGRAAMGGGRGSPRFGGFTPGRSEPGRKGGGGKGGGGKKKKGPKGRSGKTPRTAPAAAPAGIDPLDAFRASLDKEASDKKSRQTAAVAQAASDKRMELHNPFHNKHHLGKGPKGHERPETKCWQCGRCPNIYANGCTCKSTGRGKNCPKRGTIKHIRYDAAAHRAYNKVFHDFERRIKTGKHGLSSIDWIKRQSLNRH